MVSVTTDDLRESTHLNFCSNSVSLALSGALTHSLTLSLSLSPNNSRFLLNIPKEDQDDPMKLCTHIELAYWFYLDLVRPEDSTLPGCSMKEFMAASIL